MNSVQYFMKVLMCLLIVVACVVPYASNASCAAFSSDELVAQADIILEGTIISINPDATAQVTVNETFKGSTQQMITVSGRPFLTSTSTIDVTFEPNARYLLFLSNPPNPNAAYSTNQCTGTRLLQEKISNQERHTLGAQKSPPPINTTPPTPITLSPIPWWLQPFYKTSAYLVLKIDALFTYLSELAD